MAHNFCSPGLCEKISCSSAFCDGYEPSCLLEAGGSGFLVAGFVRPPVVLCLEFCCHVDLDSVVLHLRSGRQLTTGVTIATATSSADWSSRDKWQRVGSYWSEASPPQPPDRVCFAIPAWKRVDGGEAAMRRLSLHSSGRRGVRALRVCLSRALGPSALCLRKLEVWAHPSNRRDALFRSVVARRPSMYSSSRAENFPQPSSDHRCQSKTPEAPTEKARYQEIADRCEIPEVMLDAITCEIMVLPIVLPSGHTIDQRTLEKHTQVEAGWGRPPGNPFTGVPFSSSGQPVPDPSLKARIDQFMFDNSTKISELAAVGRTIGRSSDRCTTDRRNSTSIVHRTSSVESAVVEQENPKPFTGDLDTCLRSALSGLTSFRPSASTSGPAPAVCPLHSDATVRYRLPCGHVVCRRCLLGELRRCSVCDAAFSPADVCRIHA